MIKKSIVMSIGLSSVALAMGATDAYAAERGTVTTDVLNVRSAPGTSNSIIGKLYRGNTVDVLETSNGWYKVTLSNGQTGWASSDYIKLGSTSGGGSTEESVSGTGTVNTDTLNVRSGAGTSYSVVTKVHRNDKVELLAKSNGWYKIKTSNGQIGWASGDYITLGSTSGGGSTEESVSGTGTVNTDTLNVRSGAGTSYSVVTKVHRNDKVELLAKSNGWYKIKTSNGQIGWASSDYITLGSTGGGSTEESVSGTGTVTTDALNVRSGAGTSYSVVTKVYRNDKVELLAKSNGWYKIKTSNGQIGWASSDYITLGSTGGGSTEESVSGTGTVTTDALNVRSGAGTSYSVVTKVYRNDKVELLAKSNGWYKIKTSNGQIGWASSDYITLGSTGGGSEESKPSSSKRDAVVNLAKQQIGKPYVWGAEGPNSFDCSGLTYYVYKNAGGVTLPRTSREQSTFGTTINKSDLQPGDLIFASTDGSGNVSHVGIYIGNGEMIHSPKPGDVVQRTSINNSYWNGAYLWAKRVL